MDSERELGIEGEGHGDRRAFPRFKVHLRGVCSIAGGGDATCVVRDMSVGGMALLCPAEPEVGASVSLLLPQVGRLQGTIVRSFDGGFAVSYALGRAQYERVAAYLIWLIERGRASDIEDRAEARIVPLRRVVEVLAGGWTSTARIVDVSRSGVALTTTRRVEVGDELTVGSRLSVVVRLTPDGFAARFSDPLPEGFDAAIVL